MNVTEMHIAVQQGVDKIHSLQADMLLSEEIDIELNKNMSRFINTKYGKNNIYQKGFEESQKRIDDLRTLVTEYEASVTFKEVLSEGQIWVDTFQLPFNYMYLVNQSSRVWIDGCKPITYELENPVDVAFFALNLNSFVCNNATGTSAAFIESITMTEDIDDGTSNVAPIWAPTISAVYPTDIEAIKQDIIDNPGDGFEIYWEQYSTLNYPGNFIVVVNTELYPWFNPDSSMGAQTQAVGEGAGDVSNVYSPALLMDNAYSEKRVPAAASSRIMSGNRFSQQDDIFTLLKDPFNTTKHTTPLTTIRGQAIDVYTSDIFIIDTVKITYIRRPNEISLSLGVDCELPDHAHQEIVSMAVSSILEEISDPRYKTAVGEVSRNE
jgi:hypothetical protein|tara:strand:+ start:893 stop:2032 length:1140 start_codon:yes stop_codon:yes gene_type:complete